MSEQAVAAEKEDLDSFIAAFEAAQARDGQADLSAFLPDPGHPLYREVLRELVRVDLEWRWSSGQPARVEDYRVPFPQLFQDPEDLLAISFEEYRLRRQAGEDPSPEEYQRRLGVDTRKWPAGHHWILPANGRHQPPDESTSAYTTTGAMPEVGAKFLGFHLMAQLGQGAFGRVYLARQGELADRPVVLKICRDIISEARTLAQLQHTNIVPIYSIHHADPWHAVCMPFFGSTTLADVLRGLRREGVLPGSGKALLDTMNACKSRTHPGENGQSFQSHSDDSSSIPAPEVVAHPANIHLETHAATSLKTLAGLTYVESVLWMAARLADGLGHAHEHGILHRDLKPANILLADDGQPMLLDFNLSEDSKLRSGIPASFIGGTLPYMAPEHLTAMQLGTHGVDARSDLFALGVILYELLTSRLPFGARHGVLEEVLARMRVDRLQLPAKLRQWNPAVSPAVESIILHCLEPDPSGRYQTAGELKEDLERQLSNLPLRHAREFSLRERTRKWVRRHPRLASASSIATLAAFLLLGLGALFAFRGERLSRFEAADSLARFRQDMRATQILFLEAPTTSQDRLQSSAASCRHALDCFHVLDDPSWQRSDPFRRLSADDQERLRADVGELFFLLAALTRMQADPEMSTSQSTEKLRSALELNGRAESC